MQKKKKEEEGERKGREEGEEKMEKEKGKGERRERKSEDIWRMHGICLRDAKSSQRSQAYFLLIDIQAQCHQGILAYRKQLGD